MLHKTIADSNKTCPGYSMKGDRIVYWKVFALGDERKHQ